MAVLTGVSGELHLVGVDSQNRALHAIRHSDGTWTPFGDVMAVAGSPGTVLFDVTLAEVDDPSSGELRLFFVGVAQGGLLLFTIRDRVGNWTAVANLNAILGGGPFKGVAAAAAS